WALPVSPDVVDGQSNNFPNANVYPVDARGIAYSMGFIGIKHVGTGQYYLVAIKDSRGESFDGAKVYRLQVPPNAPVRQYWSVTVYDRATHAFIRDVDRYSRSSNSPQLQKNADGGEFDQRHGHWLSSRSTPSEPLGHLPPSPPETSDGILMIAAQALEKRTVEQEKEIAELKARLEALELAPEVRNAKGKGLPAAIIHFRSAFAAPSPAGCRVGRTSNWQRPHPRLQHSRRSSFGPCGLGRRFPGRSPLISNPCAWDLASN